MEDWRSIKIPGIASIRKCVAEFEIQELEKTPYSKFKVKIFEGVKGELTGYTNLLINDTDGCPYPGVGRGFTIEDTLKNTLINFLETLSQKELWHKDEFTIADPSDF
ncbi:hypothetical protein MKZ07_32780 [Paenibacillus sp. FSL P4-0338]|uniref:hypothetical protein n=1 Tax=unclassified Paenibacillus TaxID=185978 RepID=UPI0003E20BE6|nr:hypothetical protein [Paenibacillus sp. FSL R7-269]ETT46685.1 hypothetical protein C162_19549 [Paenibacillus sp. FSL R7-269]